VDVLRAKKPKGGTWERLPRSPFEIVVRDADPQPNVPRTNSPPKSLLVSPGNTATLDTVSPKGTQSAVDVKLATAEPVPLSKITLPRLPSIPSTPSTPSPSSSSCSLGFIDKETVNSAISAALAQTPKKLSHVEPVISWTVIVHGLLACLYVGFLITKTLREN
jgi:hypothetical protein